MTGAVLLRVVVGFGSGMVWRVGCLGSGLRVGAGDLFFGVGMAGVFGVKSWEGIPRPAGGRGNDWRGADLPPPEGFRPWLPVSVVMPAYQTPGAVLARTLAALEGQTYPRDLFEVVMVDDGSAPPLAPPPSALNVRVVRQERRGYGTPRARNAGVRAAAHSIILFLDSDTMVEAGWMAAHARWHHFVSDVLTVGMRAHLAADDIDADAIRSRDGTLRELFAGRPVDPPWTEDYMRHTKDMTSGDEDPFRVVVGNFGIGRDFYWQAGGCDESFVRCGMEDIEFAYRVYIQGGLFAPVRDEYAFAWHQGRWDAGRDEKRRITRINQGNRNHLIAHPNRLRDKPGRIYAVPRYVVTIDGGDCAAEGVIEAAGRILDDREFDLVVRIELGDDGGGERLARLRDVFGPEPRARVAPGGDALEEFPASPFQVRLPATVRGKDLVRRLRAGLGDAVIATAALPDGGAVTIARARALHRARRNGGMPGDFGESRRMDPGRLKLRVVPAGGERPGGAARYAGRVWAKWGVLRERWRDVHTPREAWWLARWVALWCRRRRLGR